MFGDFSVVVFSYMNIEEPGFTCKILGFPGRHCASQLEQLQKLQEWSVFVEHLFPPRPVLL